MSNIKSPIRKLKCLVRLLLLMFPFLGSGQTLNISAGVQRYLALTNTTITLTGQCELHLTATNNMMTTITPMDAMPGCVVNLNSPNAWLYLDGTRPYRVNLNHIYVNGAPAVNGSNVRLTEYGMGAVVIPQSPGYQPLTVFSGAQFSGSSNQLSLYTYYNGTTSINGETNNVAVPFSGAVGSFVLKHGYAATFAKNADGSGPSRVYVAAVDDVQLGALPPGLNNGVGFIRCYPWNWKPKKGWAGGDNGDALLVDTPWNYDWGSGASSSSSAEYAPMQWGNGYSTGINNKQGSTLLLGFNEPDSSSQANMTTTAAINDWTNLLNSGLRLGSPACTDGGWSSWLFPFINAADAAGMRVDTVEQHMYMCGQSASSLQNWMWNIHVNTGRRVGLTEFNNGANWTTCAEPTPDQEASTIQAFIQMMDTQNFVEGYNIYEWVQNSRMMVLNGVLTAAGTNYLNEWSPIAYLQELSGNPKWSLAINGGVGPTNATYDLNGNVLDSSGNGNNAMLAGTHTFAGTAGNQVLQLDGINDYVVLPPNVGDSANFTFAGWVYWNGGATWQRIFDLGLDTSKYLFLTPDSGSGTLRFAINGGGGEQQLNASPLTPGVWTHVAVTLNGGTATLYTNGVVAASMTTLTNHPSSLGLVYCNLGKSQFFADPLFSGALSDVVIDGFAFSAAQIASLAATPPTVNISAPAAPTGLTATAVSSSQVNLAWTGSSSAASYNVKRGTSPSGPYTIISQGITSTSFSDTLGNAGTTYYYVVSAVNGSGESANSTAASATTAAGVPGVPTGVTAHAGTWQITLNWMASQSPGAASYNIKRATTSGGPYTTIATGVSAPAAGSYLDSINTAGTYYYVISGVNAYGESANSAQVSATLRDLYAYWKFDETSGSTATDSAGNNNGTLGSGCSWVAGETNGAIYLDGTSNAYVNLPGGLADPLTDFTIATWVNWQGTNGWQRIFDFGTGTSSYMFLTPKAGSSGPLRFAITASGSGNEQQLNASGPLSTNVWHHVAVTLSNTTAILYLDGVAVNTNNNMTVEPSSLGGTTHNNIGQSQFADPHLIGSVDDFHLYGRALSAAEVWNIGYGPVPPAVPTGLSATASTNNQIALNWNASGGAVSYNVKRSTVSGGPYTAIATGVTATTYNDSGLAAGTTYYYVVSAVNSYGESATSAEASGTVQIVVGNFGFESPVTSTYVYNPSGASWTFSGGSPSGSGVTANGSAFTSGNTPAPEGTQVAFLQATCSVSQAISGLTAGTTYSVSFYASQRQNKSGGQVGQTLDVRIDGTTIGSFTPVQSNTNYVLFSTNFTASATTHTLGFFGTDRNGGDNTCFIDDVQIALVSACNIPSAPTGLNATGGNAQVSLSWTAVANATSYTVKRATSSAGPFSQIASGVTATSYVDTGLSAGTTYYYVVDAVDSCGTSADSSYRGATTIPPAPTGLTATAGNNQVALTWSAATGASSYNVKRATVSGGPYTTLTNITTASFTDTTAVNGTTYYYVVSAVNSSGESANSSQVSATPSAPVAPAAPTSLAASPGRKKMTLTWTQSTSANITTNNVYRATVSGGPYTLVASIAATTTYTDSGLTTGATYYYVVTAVNSSALESPYSNQASGTSK